MNFTIFVINPGSTSTKIALFRSDKLLFEKTIRHKVDEIKGFPTASSQLEYRFDIIKKVLEENCLSLDEADAFAGRGGLLRSLEGGTYAVSQFMLDDLKNSTYGDHASNLGAIIADQFGKMFNKPVFTVNPVVVDELMDEARYTGLPEIKRKSVFHALNHKATAFKAAAETGIPYEQGRFIVAHLGGGISVGAHDRGRVVDVNNGLEEGPFSPERSGSLPVKQLVDLCFSGKYSKSEIEKLLVGSGGLYAYTATTEFDKIRLGAITNPEFKKLLNAFTYRISKEICSLAAALYGNVDRIVITGGLSYNRIVTEDIEKRVSFLAPVIVYPGEDELKALAEGVVRVLSGKEKVKTYESEVREQ